jgi:ubiquinone biosynthesis protein
MSWFTRVARGSFIVFIVLRFGLDQLVLTSFQKPWLKISARTALRGRN